MNFVGALNTIAAQYTKTAYVAKTRHMGYSDQIETCTSVGNIVGDYGDCPEDNGYTVDIDLVQKAIGSLETTTLSGEWEFIG